MARTGKKMESLARGVELLVEELEELLDYIQEKVVLEMEVLALVQEIGKRRWTSFFLCFRG